MDFIDTNIIVYANDRRDPGKQEIALNVITTAMRDKSGVISVQVLQEYAHTALGKLAQRPSVVLRQLALLESLIVISPDARMVRAHLRKVQAKGPWASSPHGLPKQARWLPHFLHLSEMRPMVGRAVELKSLFQISFWDASILAAAESAGCRRVLSEDLSDGGIYGSLQIKNPFAG